MNDPNVSLYRACATAAWSVASLLILSAWITFAAAPGQGVQRVGYMLALTGIGVAVVAGVLTMRCWTARTCSLIRLLCDDGQLEREPLRPVPLRG